MEFGNLMGDFVSASIEGLGVAFAIAVLATYVVAPLIKSLLSRMQVHH